MSIESSTIAFVLGVMIIAIAISLFAIGSLMAYSGLQEMKLSLVAQEFSEDTK